MLMWCPNDPLHLPARRAVPRHHAPGVTPEVTHTAHLDAADDWGNLAHGWHWGFRGECARWVLAVLEVYANVAMPRCADLSRLEIVCCGMTQRHQRMICGGDWTGTDLAAHVARLRSLPGTLASRPIGKNEAPILAERGHRAHGLRVVSDAFLTTGLMGVWACQ